MATAEDVHITVTTRYLDDESKKHPGHHFFLYTVTIDNRGQESLQLLRRYWKISEDNGKIREVYGEGVVGEQPLIDAGSSYTYRSGTDMNHGSGTMEGHYVMADRNGKLLEVPIPLFVLVHPNRLH